TTQTEVGVFTTDAHLVVQVWDATLARLTGIGEESAVGRELTAVVPDLEQRGLLKRFQRSLNEGVVEVLAPAFHHYLISCAPVNASKHFEKMQQRVTIAPLRDDDSIAGLIVTIEDVTERLDRERELAARLAQGDETARLNAAETLSDDESYDAAHLLDALSDDSWQVRRAAVKGVSQRAAPEAIAALLSSVVENHHNPALLNSALQVLASSEVDTLSPLVELLNGPDPDLRMQSALALGEQRDARAVAALIEALQDEDTNVQYHAVEALGKLKATESVDALAEIAESKDFFLAFAALDALAKIGDPKIAPRIVPLLNDDLLRDPAVNLLGQLGDETAVAPLTALLNTPTAPTDALANALATLSDRYEAQYREGAYIADLTSREISPTGVQNLLDALETPGKEDLRSIAVVLGWLKGSSVDRALTRLMGRVDLRNEIIDALVRHGAATVDLLISQLIAEDLEVRRSATVALGRIGDASSAPALIDALSDESMAIDAANALGQIGDPRAVDGLLKLIGNSDASTRQAAVSALNSLALTSMSERIIPLLHDSDSNVRESAVKIAGYFGYRDAAGALVDLSRDPDERVRTAAIEHLPFIEDERALDVLLQALKQETPSVRAAAARALGNMDAPQADGQLIEALSDDDVWVRYFSARALGRRRSADSVAALEKVIEEEQFNHVRIAALDSLGQIGGGRVAGIVAGLVQDDDPDVAHAAQVALGKSGQRE
ncbi:MAG TPA: HEAT repeat domain-containing protein, partial [Pyrinomonadaceae bacterium]|nr:HEAT repeat domain-containing protein [Pyrinomonadaceae bacterium]